MIERKITPDFLPSLKYDDAGLAFEPSQRLAVRRTIVDGVASYELADLPKEGFDARTAEWVQHETEEQVATKAQAELARAVVASPEFASALATAIDQALKARG